MSTNIHITLINIVLNVDLLGNKPPGDITRLIENGKRLHESELLSVTLDVKRLDNDTYC